MRIRQLNTGLMARLLDYMQACHDASRERHFRRQLSAVGAHVVLERVEFAAPHKVRLGDYVYIGPNTAFYGVGNVTVADFSIISQDVYILSSIHNYRSQTCAMIPYDEVEILKDVVIGRACWIGMRSIIMPGVVLGEGCVVGAGAVVTKSWPAGTVVAGVPATAIGQRDMEHYKRCCDKQQFYMLQKHVRNLTRIEKPSSHANTSISL
jgi:acetyltransferase-like isoleucine patch superfamily enzyme